MRRQRARGRLAVALAAGLLALGAAACTNPAAGGPAGSGPAAGQPSKGFPVSVKGKLGTAHVPSRPLRVVAMDWTDADMALSLGVKPVGMASVSTASGGIEPWTKKMLGTAKPKLFDTDSGDPVDQVAALNPDVILATKDYNLAQSYGQLSKIAPVVTYADAPNSDSWQTDTRAVARALGKTAAANAAIAKTTAVIKSARSASPALAGKTYNFLVTPETDGVHAVNTTSDVSAQFLDQLGLRLAPAVQRMKTSSIPGRAMVSWENVGQLNADVLLATGPPSSLSLIKTIPGFTGLPAVRKGAYVPLNAAVAQAIAFPSSASLTWALGQLMPRLSTAARK